MVLYPVLTGVIGLDDRMAGVFLGATIHDVAQVVGAGFSVSAEAGTAATVVKMLRVALLVPVVFAVALVARRLSGPAARAAKRPPLLPAFLLAFLALVAANSLGLVPSPAQAWLAEASRWCIVVAIAALGVKTSLASLAEVGRPAILLMVAETLFIGGAGVALVAV
ncbi:MAG: putative sulfate exporter family transporter, partial [Elioraea sp.]|nr:putative sulfate exporter family transporter [Elioraea sp.]